MSNKKEIIGMMIKQARLEQGMSLKDLANKLGVDYQLPSRWERNIHLPSSKYIHLLSKELGIEVRKLDPGLMDSTPINSPESIGNVKETLHQPNITEYDLRTILKEERELLLMHIRSMLENRCGELEEKMQERFDQILNHPIVSRTEKYLNESTTNREGLFKELKKLQSEEAKK